MSIPTDWLHELENIVGLAYEHGTSREELIGYVNAECNAIDEGRQELEAEGKRDA